MAPLTTIRQTVKEIIDLGSKSAILADQKSNLFCKQYANLQKTLNKNNEIKLDPELRRTFLKTLCTDHGLKTNRLFANISNLVNTNKTQEEFEKNFNQLYFEKLNKNLKPEYYELFQSLGRVKDGVHTLVKMRQDLLSLLEEKKKNEINFEYESDLKIMNSVLKSLLVLWFSTGLLNIQRIDWNHSPAVLVEKIAHYESVHQIKTLSDLKNRLSESRRCFIYTHSTMPYEPLVILHIALTNTISSNIKDLIKTSSIQKDETSSSSNEATNAIFYSINSCQKGLQQVDLGNALIKSCVRLLLEELPNLKHFHTLSPIPKFREWLDMKLLLNNSTNEMNKFLNQDELDVLNKYFQVENTSTRIELYNQIKTYLSSHKYKSDLLLESSQQEAEFQKNENASFNRSIKMFLKRACAFYLYHEKKNGYAFNSVANFHLRNGAQIYRINYGADLSDNGLKSSYGLMVNYGYYLSDLDYNCVNYLTDKKIKVSLLVNEYL